MRQTFLLFLVLFILPTRSFSQITDIKEDNYYLEIGVGQYYSTDKTNGFAQTLSINLLKDSISYKIKFQAYQEFWLFGPSPAEAFYNIGLLIGKGFTDKYVQIYFSAGIGIMGGTKRGDLLYTEIHPHVINLSDPRHFEKDEFITPSIPLEVNFMVKPIKYLALGITLFGDINYKRPMYGITFMLAFGKLR